MIMDACVLIDFVKADRLVLRLFVKHLGAVHVISPILDEVREIRHEEEITELGLVVVEPELEDAFAAAGARGPTSFQDRLCLLTAKRFGFTCVTNDTNLRKLCEKESVPILWGLQLLIQLCWAGGISAQGAMGIANEIHRANPKHITKKILQQFSLAIRKQRG